MGNTGPRDIEPVYQSFREVEDWLNRHRKVLDRILDVPNKCHARRLGPGELRDDYKHRYKTVLLETIEALEATRKSFKSKQIETLRKNLIARLGEID